MKSCRGDAPVPVPPRDAHVEALVDGDWVQALLIEQRREGAKWVCRVAWVDRMAGGVWVANEWVAAERVRPRT